jgi:hypothetical protein
MISYYNHEDSSKLHGRTFNGSTARLLGGDHKSTHELSKLPAELRSTATMVWKNEDATSMPLKLVDWVNGMGFPMGTSGKLLSHMTSKVIRVIGAN